MVSTNFSFPTSARANGSPSKSVKTHGTSSYTNSLGPLAHATAPGDSFSLSPAFAGSKKKVNNHSSKAGQSSKQDPEVKQESQGSRVKSIQIPFDYGQEVADELNEQSFDSPHSLALYWTTRDFALDISGHFHNMSLKEKLENNPNDNDLAKDILDQLNVTYETE
jgi:hypothetical protein